MAKKGHVPWNKGTVGAYSEEYRTKIAETLKKKGIKPPSRKGVIGINNPLFKIKRPAEVIKKMTDNNRSSDPIVKKKISDTMKRLKIIPPSHKGKFGELAPNWQGGLSFLPYCKKFNKILKATIKERDNYTCQLCGASNRRLSVHHIHYDKENCYPDLITLCCSDNSRVNINRKYYESLFMNQLNKRGLLFWTLSLYKEKDNVDVEEV